MRFTPLLPILLVGLSSGCFQIALEPDSYLSGKPVSGPRARLTLQDDQAPSSPACKDAREIPNVSSVTSPEGGKRPVCLAECVCLALENGRTGEFYDRVGSDRRTSVSGLQRQNPPSNATDNLRVFAYDPAIAGTELEQSLSRFDVLWRTTANWNHVDGPPGLNPGSIPIVGPLGQLQDNVGFRSELVKPLPTGGVAGIGLRNDYGRAFLPNGSPVLNPANVAGLDFTFEQPLLQGAGVLMNQLRETFPVSPNLPVPSPVLPQQGRVPGILLARLNHDEARLEFERRVHEALFVVAEAYWDLYYAYWDLYSRESGMRLTQLAWQLTKQRFDAGGAAAEEMAQIEEQYHLFRSQRLESLGRGTPGRPGVLEAERRLRYVTGMPAEDGTRLVPTDAPRTAPMAPDWNQAVLVAGERRPELLQIHKEIQAAQLNVLRARDYLRPDLRLTSRYGINDLEGRSGLAAGGAARNPFSSWEVGVQFQVPVGFRAGNAEVARANLQLSQRYTFLRDQEDKVVLSLQRSYRDVVQFREEMQTRLSQREAAALQLRSRYEKFKAGKETVDLLVRTQRTWADALRDEYNAICKYNVALADFERQKGTIMDSLNVSLADGPVPLAAYEDASRHIRRHHQTQVRQTAAVPSLPRPPAAERDESATVSEVMNHSHLQMLNWLRPDTAPPNLTPLKAVE